MQSHEFNFACEVRNALDGELVEIGKPFSRAYDVRNTIDIDRVAANQREVLRQ